MKHRYICIMFTIGLLREEKIPADNRVALVPAQCRWIRKNYPQIRILVQPSETRCYSNREYTMAGVELSEDLTPCDALLGIKEVPPQKVIPGKKYFIFSHTCKKQPHNQQLLQKLIEHKCTLIDYECLKHPDGQRIIGFGFFAGIVGAHNGMMAYGERTQAFKLERVYMQRDFKTLIHTYFGLQIPNIKIAVTGSGRVAHGILEIMNLMGIIEVEKDEFLARDFTYPVYVQLKGQDLYRHKKEKNYTREHFHHHPEEYECLFTEFITSADILMNGVYWDKNVPRLFEKKHISDPSFSIQVIADITDDCDGSVPINYGDQTIENPIYGVNKLTFEKTPPYQQGSVDVMAVGNLPNELPRDASRYFGEQLLKYVLRDVISGGSEIIESATIVKDGHLTSAYDYLHDYATGPVL